MKDSDHYVQRLIEETRQLVAETRERIASACEADPVDPAYIENLKKVLETQEELLTRFDPDETAFG